ncbi:MAG TPA: replication/maintenance protein, partial [Cyanobacteria bacterium UBA11369]|nr:replication/maintenance protein [Cyanobacteria bacterium UBA11369]
TFSCSQLLPLEADILWKIERGVVRTFTWNEEGRSITLGYWGAGDIVGQPLSRIQPYQIECLTSAEVSSLAANLWYQAADAMISHIQRSEELLAIIHSRPVNQRLLELLGWLAQRFGREVDKGKLIEVPLTHQALSEVICTTRVTVTRLLNQFEQKDLINRHGRYLILCRKSQTLDF